MMTKEVTKTTVKAGKIVVIDGLPQVEMLGEEILLGNVNMEKAQKEVQKKHDEQITVFEVSPDTTVYEMPVEEFIKHASVKVDKEEQPQDEQQEQA